MRGAWRGRVRLAEDFDDFEDFEDFETLLDGIPGAYERAQEGAQQAAEGNTVPHDELD